MTERIPTDELATLVRTVFAPRADDRAAAVVIDLPDAARPDRPAWAERREMARDWAARLGGAAARLGLERVSLVAVRNARRNNADLPERCALLAVDVPVPDDADAVDATTPLAEVLDAHSILLVPTELSATAPLKLAARRHGFRAASMPGFSPAMIPALRLDYAEIDARCRALKDRLDVASGAVVRTTAAGRAHELRLDLRHRAATASGGLVREPGTAGNLPSGETYVVPYEGERSGDPSATAGELPLQLDGETMVLDIEGNRVVGVRGDGPVARRERREFEIEPAYANLAELGLGVLGGYGVRPVGEILLDEKLGLHIAFGRSDHFGGQVGAADFSAPDRVVHIDRIYIPELQPAVAVDAVDLDIDGRREPLMRAGRIV